MSGGSSTLAAPAAWRNVRLPRPTLDSEALLLLVVAFLLVAVNGPFWSSLLGTRSFAEAGTWRFAASSFVALAALHFFCIGLFATRRLIRPLLSVLVVASILTAYYMHHYGIVMDPGMMRNMLRTDWHEARELLNPAMFGYLLLSLVPVAAIWRVQLRVRPKRQARWRRVGSLAAALLIGVGALLLAFQDFGSAMRGNKAIRYQLTPGNLLWSGSRVLVGDARSAVAVREPAEPAHRVLLAGGMRKPTLLVMVVGETARAANFGLNGYARMNTPELAQRDVINFPQTTACGTSTEVSVPCMFSPFGRADYDEERIRNHESLLHLVERAGLKVSWLDNQSGCKGVCSGLDFVDLGQARSDAYCSDGHCMDGILVQALQGKVEEAAPARDRMIVLHQLGNHGPAYFRRYPKAFERYAPACANNDLGTCSKEEIVNAYDNAIAYTDHVLAQTIAYLETLQDRYDVAMIYVSDHGESLGEHGLFLHGVPYAIAPKEQTAVPMVWWLPQASARNLDVDLACLRTQAQQPASHDNLFSSVLGLLNIETPRYRKERDLLAACRNDERHLAGSTARPRA
ncbi:MAG TPA: phosphoethanolamine--lipid A transferase [Rhodocyclaceae bacterium]|nr:phosphoethanolamine--lipid A transferase [Rhodocyclaceae bacterium]